MSRYESYNSYKRKSLINKRLNKRSRTSHSRINLKWLNFKNINWNWKKIAIIASSVVIVLTAIITTCVVVSNYKNTYYTKELVFTLNPDRKSYSVAGYSQNKPENECVIPATYNKMPVTEVADNAFNGYKGTMTKLVIGKNVTRLGVNCFKGTTIQNIAFQKNLKIIDDGAFACGAPNFIEIPESVEYIGNNALFGSFKKIFIPSRKNLYMGCITNSNTVKLEFGDIQNFIMTEDLIPQTSYNIENFYSTTKNNVTYFGGKENPYLIAYNTTAKDVKLENGCRVVLGNFLTSSTGEKLVLPNTVTSISKKLIERYATNHYYYEYPESKKWNEIVLSDNLQYCGSKLKTDVYYDKDDLYYVPSNNNHYFYLYSVVNSSDTEYNITNSCKMIGYNAIVNNNVTSINIPSSVKSICSNAFSCNKLTELTIPSTVNTVYTGALDKLTNLQNLTLSKINNNYLFDKFTPISSSVTKTLNRINFKGSCSDFIKIDFAGLETFNELAINDNIVEDVVIQNVRNIRPKQFKNWNFLKSVKILGSVETVGYNAFLNCENLKEVVISPSVQNIGIGILNGCYNIENVTIPFIGVNNKTPSNFGDYILLSKDYNENEHYSNTYQYQNYNKLKNVKVTNASEFGIYALSSLPTLEKIDLSGCNITKLSEYFAYESLNLNTAIIPNSITEIGGGAFQSCKLTDTFKFPNNLKVIGNGAFCNNQFKKVTIPGSVTTIEGSAFASNAELEKIIFNNNITELKQYVLSNCKKLTEFTIPSKVKSIGAYAFNNCESLAKLTIPASVTTLGEGCFANTGITTLHFPKNITTNVSDIFSHCKNLEVVTADKNANVFSFIKDCPSLKRVVGPYSCRFVFALCESLEYVETSAPINMSLYEMFRISQTATAGLEKPEWNEKYYVKTLYEYGLYAYCAIPKTLRDVVFSGDKNNTIRLGNRFFKDYDHEINLTIAGNIILENESHTFDNFTGLNKLTYNGTIEDYCNITFNGESLFKHAKEIVVNGKPLEEIDFTNLTTVNENLFQGIKQIKRVKYSKKLTNFPANCFYGCTNIETVEYVGTLHNYCNVIFENEYSNPTYYGANLIIDKKLATDVVMENKTTKIGNYAFINCPTLQTFKLSNNIREIGFKAFSGCNNLQKYLENGTYLIKSNNGIRKAIFGFETYNEDIIKNPNVILLENSLHGITNLRTLYINFELGCSINQLFDENADYTSTTMYVPSSIENIIFRSITIFKAHSVVNIYKEINIYLPSSLAEIEGPTFYNRKTNPDSYWGGYYTYRVYYGGSYNEFERLDNYQISGYSYANLSVCQYNADLDSLSW